jgi:hypothetical protein
MEAKSLTGGKYLRGMQVYSGHFGNMFWLTLVCVCVGQESNIQFNEMHKYVEPKGVYRTPGTGSKLYYFKKFERRDRCSKWYVHPGRLSVPWQLNYEQRGAAVRILLLTELQTCATEGPLWSTAYDKNTKLEKKMADHSGGSSKA